MASCREQANHLTEWINPVPFPSACQSGLLHLLSVWYGVDLRNLSRSPAFHGCSCWLGTELDWWTVMVNTLSCAAIYFSYLWYLFQLRMSKNLPVHGNCFPILDTSPSCQEGVLSSLQHTYHSTGGIADEQVFLLLIVSSLVNNFSFNVLCFLAHT